MEKEDDEAKEEISTKLENLFYAHKKANRETRWPCLEENGS